MSNQMTIYVSDIKVYSKMETLYRLLSELSHIPRCLRGVINRRAFEYVNCFSEAEYIEMIDLAFEQWRLLPVSSASDFVAKVNLSLYCDIRTRYMDVILMRLAESEKSGCCVSVQNTEVILLIVVLTTYYLHLKSATKMQSAKVEGAKVEEGK